MQMLVESRADLRMKDAHVSGRRCGRSLAVSGRGVEISVGKVAMEHREGTH